VTGTSRVTNTATRTSSSPVDPVAANDVAHASVTGSTVPGLPNNGVPPVAQLWPAAPAAVLIALAFAGWRSRSRSTRRP
jgi:hypothetical protein